jgi:hypothetical protein
MRGATLGNKPNRKNHNRLAKYTIEKASDISLTLCFGLSPSCDTTWRPCSRQRCPLGPHRRRGYVVAHGGMRDSSLEQYIHGSKKQDLPHLSMTHLLFANEHLNFHYGLHFIANEWRYKWQSDNDLPAHLLLAGQAGRQFAAAQWSTAEQLLRGCIL